jgi:hypothetical protein
MRVRLFASIPICLLFQQHRCQVTWNSDAVAKSFFLISDLKRPKNDSHFREAENAPVAEHWIRVVVINDQIGSGAILQDFDRLWTVS